MTIGDLFSDAQRQSIIHYMNAGKGIVCMHTGGVGTETNWPWWVKMVGTTFRNHPHIQTASIKVESKFHPATNGFFDHWVWNEEYFSFNSNPRDSSVRVLLSVDEKSYSPLWSAMGDHPLAWCKFYEGGRFFQTALGHNPEAYSDLYFLRHIQGAILWASGRENDYTPVALTGNETMLDEEFDGLHNQGSWKIQAHPDKFRYDVNRDVLVMYDSTRGYNTPNQHLTREGLFVNPKKAYSIEGLVKINTLGTAYDPSSFCFNFNIDASDTSLSTISCWSIPIDLHLEWGPSVMKFMGFNNSQWFGIGERPIRWCREDTEYFYKIGVNQTKEGKYKFKTVSVTIMEGDRVWENFDVDFSKASYQPDFSKPVSVGVNTHGGNWQLRNFKVYYVNQ